MVPWVSSDPDYDALGFKWPRIWCPGFQVTQNMVPWVSSDPDYDALGFKWPRHLEQCLDSAMHAYNNHNFHISLVTDCQLITLSMMVAVATSMC